MASNSYPGTSPAAVTQPNVATPAIPFLQPVASTDNIALENSIGSEDNGRQADSIPDDVLACDERQLWTEEQDAALVAVLER